MLKKWILCAGLFGSFAVSAIEFKITPSGASKSDMEKRVDRLEWAVQELQAKVFNLQVENTALKGEAKKEKGYFCHISVFGKTYKAFGPTKLETSEKVKEACAADSNEIHCRNMNCQVNE